MSKIRSYVDIKSIPMSNLNGGIALSALLSETKYDDISEADKGGVIILKEAFVLLDRKRKRIGAYTRSDKDHGTKIGQCSALLCGNFDRGECTITKDGIIIYDVKARLHSYIKEISGLFSEKRSKSIPTIYYHDKERDKRYLFLVFELTCDSSEMPLCYRLDNRADDLFIGMRDIKEVASGIQRYNKSAFNVDQNLVEALTICRLPRQQDISKLD